MTEAIDKIIKEMAFRDYKGAFDRYPKNFKEYYKGYRSKKPKGYEPFCYSLSAETIEAMQIKTDYIEGKINEEQYKGFCLRYNLTHLEAK